VGGQLVIEEGEDRQTAPVYSAHACKEAWMAAADRLKDIFVATGGVV
jgi:hypothetical protein